MVELLRADVDAWKIGDRTLEIRRQAIVGGRPGFVNADTALAHLRRMVEKGVSDRLRPMDEMKIWFPDEEDKEKSGEPEKDEG